MALTLALLLTQFGLAWAIVSQACEHRHACIGERRLFLLRAAAAAALMAGVITTFLAIEFDGQQSGALGRVGWDSSFSPPDKNRNFYTDASSGLRAAACWAIFGLGLISLKRFGGPYCGGSDLMTLQISLAMAVAESSSNPTWRLAGAGYLAIQVCLSYWQSGWVKLVNPQWRRGIALREVFAYTHYPVSEATRAWANFPRLLWGMGWLIMLVEFLFPLTLYYRASFAAALCFMGLFHLANAWFFGLNRFFWIWLATYPTLIAWHPIMAEFLRR